MKSKLLLTTTTLLLLFCQSCTSPQTTPNELKADNYGDIVITKVVSVYDGDTFRVDINDYPPIVGRSMPIRINGIDCPELRDKKEEVKEWARRARGFTEDKLMSAKVVRLENMKRGKYFRIICDVEVDGQDLGSMLIEEKLARRYDGGKRGEWEVNDNKIKNMD